MLTSGVQFELTLTYIDNTSKTFTFNSFVDFTKKYWDSVIDTKTKNIAVTGSNDCSM